MDSNPVQIGGYQNHVHILCLLSRKHSQAELIQKVKQGSSKWMKSMSTKYRNFYWQDGYGIFSASPMRIDKVNTYIKNQAKHHKNLSFKDELKMFLNKYQIEYDERYLWDWHM